jgi:glycosyltransferase involved in cell wall biosynthesis
MGRLAAEKGVDVLLVAWKRVTESASDALLRVYGDGEQRGALEALVRKLNLTGVSFMGRYEAADLDDILGSSNVTVHPARWAENSPYTVRESLERGVPAIVSDVGGLPEMVTSDTGAVVPSESPNALAGAISDELRRCRARTPRLTDAVRARAMSPNSHSRELVGLYELALEDRRRRDHRPM